MKAEPKTIEAIKETIQQCKNIQMLEQLTIDHLERKLKELEPTEEQKFRDIKPLTFRDFDIPKH